MARIRFRSPSGRHAAVDQRLVKLAGNIEPDAGDNRRHEVGLVVRHVGADGDRAGTLDDMALEHHEAEGEHHRQRADEQADFLRTHLVGIDQALAHRQQQRAT